VRPASERVVGYVVFAELTRQPTTRTGTFAERRALLWDV
jgi:hypothetical protein